jgi:PIN domain nuclease of toxin-antitoxin system
MIDQAVVRQRPIALDTSALLEFFSDTNAYGQFVGDILENVSIPLVYSTVTICEALVRPARLGNRGLVSTIQMSLERRPNTRIVSFDSTQALETAQIRAVTNLKLPDSAVVAVAVTCGGLGIIGADRKWRTRELGVPFYYLPELFDAERG